MHDLFLKIFDCLFPPSETLLRVRDITPQMMRSKYCLSKHDEIQSLASYADGDIQALIQEAKFHGNTKAFTLLNILITEHIAHTNTSYDLIIPIPLPRARLRARGYNQVHEILRAGDLNTPLNTNILKRVRHTRPQTELTKQERLKNIHHAFGIINEACIEGMHILLVDDVTTTGATLHEAKKALQAGKPASITCLAIAH